MSISLKCTRILSRSNIMFIFLGSLAYFMSLEILVLATEETLLIVSPFLWLFCCRANSRAWKEGTCTWHQYEIWFWVKRKQLFHFGINLQANASAYIVILMNDMSVLKLTWGRDHSWNQLYHTLEALSASLLVTAGIQVQTGTECNLVNRFPSVLHMCLFHHYIYPLTSSNKLQLPSLITKKTELCKGSTPHNAARVPFVTIGRERTKQKSVSYFAIKDSAPLCVTNVSWNNLEEEAFAWLEKDWIFTKTYNFRENLRQCTLHSSWWLSTTTVAVCYVLNACSGLFLVRP